MLSFLKSILWVFPGCFGLLWDPFRIPTINALESFTMNEVYIRVRSRTNRKYIRSDLNKIIRVLKKNSIQKEKLLKSIEYFYRHKPNHLFTSKDKSKYLVNLKNHGGIVLSLVELNTSSLEHLESDLRCLSVNFEEVRIDDFFKWIEGSEEFCQVLDQEKIFIQPCEGDDYWGDNPCGQTTIDFKDGTCISGVCSGRSNMLSKKDLKRYKKVLAKQVDNLSKNVA